MSENLSALSGKKGLKENLFEKIVEAGKLTGTPDQQKLQELSKEYLMGDANLYGTTSFYDFIKKENEGKKVYVCNGSACMLAGTQDSLKEKLSNHFKPEEIGEMCCLGRCYENSAFHYNGTNFSGTSIDEVTNIIQSDLKPVKDYYVGRNVDEPVLTGDNWSNEELVDILNEVLAMGRDRALEEILSSKIRGRGGAGFPMGKKFKLCKDEQSDQKFIVCNADEGDPGAFSDRYILEQKPELLLLGMIIAGYIIGADKGVLYIRAEYPEAITVIRQTMDRFRDAGLTGTDLLGSGHSFYFKLIEGAGAYICGEETALLSSIEGQRPEVRIRPPYPAQQGLFNKPTIVNNVETLACIPMIIRKGGIWFSDQGTEYSNGTKLVCLDSFFNRPGLYEVRMGTPLDEIIYELGQGFKEDVKALHVGGPLGGIVPIQKTKDLLLGFQSFQDEGFLLGHASILSIPSDYPMIKYLEHLFEFTADESCGKCFPCSIGSVRGKEMLHKAQDDHSFKIDKTLMLDLLDTLEIGSLCALGGGLPLGVKNAMQYFDEELREYFN